MKTIETKIAKNGSTRYYVRENGKLRQISAAEATNQIVTNILDDREANQAIIAAIDEYSISNEALNIATNAEIDNAIAEIKRDIEDIISERDEAFDELDIAEANEDIAQWVIDELKETIANKLDEYNVCEMMIARLEESRPVNDTPDNNDNQPANITAAETDGSEDDTDEDIFNLLPSLDELNDVNISKSAYFDGRDALGYIFKMTVAINKSFDGTRPWTIESADGNITIEGRTWQDYAKVLVTETDGSEDDAEDDNPFDLLPDLDELNDVNDVEPVIQPLRQTFIVKPDGNEFCQIFTDNDVVTYLNGEFKDVFSTKYAACYFGEHYNLRYRWYTPDKYGVICANEEHTDNAEKFFAEMERRGACSFDTPDDDNPPDDNSFASVFAAEFDENGNCHVELNGEHVQISNGKLSYVKAPRYNLAFDPDKKRFTYFGRVIAKSKVATIINNKNLAIDQRDKLREFFRPYIHSNGAFEYLISIDYCDDSDSNFGARFDTYEQAYDFAKNVDIMLKKFAGVKSFARIRITSNRELIYERDFDGNKFWTLSNESANYLAAAADNPDLPAPVFTADINDDNRTFIGQDGTKFIATGDAVNISTKGTNLTINGRPVANYQTIKAALAAADYVYYFAKEIYDDNFLPEFDYDPDEPDTVFDNRNKRDRSKATIYIDKPQYLVEVATRINKFNHDAPHGWEIIFDAENKLFAVEFTGEHVANLDSLALTNILTPEEFFAQYAPLVNHGHAQEQFISEREAEIAQLQAMKADLGNDAERLKILDDLIADNQREISATINAG